jgi:DNA-binding NarL/FixJ family response regulator
MKHANVAKGRNVSDAVGSRALSASLLHASRGHASVALRAASPIRVVIVAGERLVAEGLRVLLSRGHGIQVVSDATTWQTALTTIRRTKPDVVVLDADGLGIESAAAVRLIAGHSAHSRTLVVAGAGYGAQLARALRAGASGCVSRNAVPADVTRAIHAVYQGDVWVERCLIAELVNGDDAAKSCASSHPERGLTVREEQILRHLASGGTNRRIAQALSISEKTVKTHLANIFRKLNVTRRLQAVLYAIQQGLREP